MCVQCAVLVSQTVPNRRRIGGLNQVNVWESSVKRATAPPPLWLYSLGNVKQSGHLDPRAVSMLDSIYMYTNRIRISSTWRRK